MNAKLSVVIPAHDEERVIGRLLSGLVDTLDELEVVVVANGCRDATAQRARSAHPAIEVDELAEASKIAALNRGDTVATAFPRAYVDADVEVDGAVLLALAEVLEGDRARVASPELNLDLSGASRAVRAYYAIWQLTEFRQAGHIGSGVYALSRAGRERFAEFPPVIGDDRFVQGLFAPDERVTLRGQRFTVRAPADLGALVRRGARIAAGNRQLQRSHLEGHAPTTASSFAGLARRVVGRPGLWPAFLLYCAVQLRTRRLAARKLAAGAVSVWDRDETSRV